MYDFAKPQGPEVLLLAGARSCACRMWQKVAYLMKKDASDARVRFLVVNPVVLLQCIELPQVEHGIFLSKKFLT